MTCLLLMLRFDKLPNQKNVRGRQNKDFDVSLIVHISLLIDFSPTADTVSPVDIRTIFNQDAFIKHIMIL